MDFLDSMKSYIEQNVALFVTPIEVGLLKDGNSIAIRPTPSSPNDRHLDGSKIVPYGFQILVKHKTNRTAYNMIETICGALDGLGKDAVVSSDGSFIFDKCEAYTWANLIGKNDMNEWEYTALFTAELLL